MSTPWALLSDGFVKIILFFRLHKKMNACGLFRHLITLVFITTSLNALAVNCMESYNRKKKTTGHINLNYFGHDGSGEIIKLTSNKLILINKFRWSVHHSPGLYEEITEIIVKKKALTIITTTYRSGYFASLSTINLH